MRKRALVINGCTPFTKVVWNLVELYVFKTKRDSLGNIERYKAKLIAKGFTQK